MTSIRRNAWRAGDWVEVRSPREIAETLDENGTLDGLPFMPEMLEYCGQRLRVSRLAERTCVEYPGGEYRIREFNNNDVLILDIPRCSGAAHDGCQRACTLFWKSSWLTEANGRRSTPVTASEMDALRSAIKTVAGSGRYFCQSTELDKATRPMSRARKVWKCFLELRSGSRGLWETVRLIVVPIWRYFIAYRLEAPLTAGTLKRTPTRALELQPGEFVRIKPEAEIVETLDAGARNRGLSCDRGMRTFCGGEYKVRHRLDRMISEATGQMRTVENTVVLEGLHCMCWWNHVGGCPREDFMYWREIWLERAAENGTSSETR